MVVTPTTRFGDLLLVPPPRLRQVEEGLYCGGYPNLRNFRYLLRLRLRVILSVVPEEPTADLQDFCRTERIQLRHIPCEKYKDRVSLLPNDVCSILECTLNRDLHPIYIHCLDGRHVCSYVVMVLRRLLGWTPEAVQQEYLRWTQHVDSVVAEYQSAGEVTGTLPLPPSACVARWLWDGDLFDSDGRQRRHPTIKFKYPITATAAGGAGTKDLLLSTVASYEDLSEHQQATTTSLLPVVSSMYDVGYAPPHPYSASANSSVALLSSVSHQPQLDVTLPNIALVSSTASTPTGADSRVHQNALGFSSIAQGTISTNSATNNANRCTTPRTVTSVVPTHGTSMADTTGSVANVAPVANTNNGSVDTANNTTTLLSGTTSTSASSTPPVVLSTAGSAAALALAAPYPTGLSQNVSVEFLSYGFQLLGHAYNSGGHPGGGGVSNVGLGRRKSDVDAATVTQLHENASFT